jgi:hypothetical protein
MAQERAVARALREWREAEQKLADTLRGSPESVDAAIAVDEAHRAYAKAMEERADSATELGRRWSNEDGRAFR